MRVFDWQGLLDQRRIPYVSRGPNVSRGEINIKCPWCGAADPSHHLGLNLETGFYSCWRNRSEHSGKSPLRLLMRLLNISYEQARELAGLRPEDIDPDGFTALVARLREGDQPIVRKKRNYALQYLDTFAPIRREGPGRRAWAYLWNRYFDHVDELCDQYGLVLGTAVPWRDRIILPFLQDGELVAWTGRAVGQSTIRYKDLEVEFCVEEPKRTLFNHDAMLTQGHTLVLVEGPMDALKLDFYGKTFGIRAVALATSSISTQQVQLLEEHCGNFKCVGIMMDMATSFGLVDSMRLTQKLSSLSSRVKIKTLAVPFGRKDAGELKAREAITFCQRLSMEVP